MDPAIQEILKHIAILNDEVGGIEILQQQMQVGQQQIAIDVAILKTQMSGLMFWFKGFAGAFIIFLGTQFWQVVIMKKNGKK